MSVAQPLTHIFNSLDDVDDISPLEDDDRQCLEEIRDVLAQHDKLDRFGVFLLHKHFDLETDEILLETTNVVDRIQTIRPVKAAALGSGGHVLETSWSLQNGETLMACKRACVKQGGNHTYEHVKSSG